ncbi:hypothetical protein NLI96_g7205 [Meripilus lineatus]|uniref:Uncharacterized protein n=1 Tax=Meripilus lineatus TaxID=2056292 RepID=A0AAD5V4C8_9APHY|nr:hypothetical protein NLI96_g7205 [Physisporinus lineatus]
MAEPYKDVSSDQKYKPLAQVAQDERAGSTERHNFPPSAPTNAVPSLFPSDVGHVGPIASRAEPALVATAPAYPLHTGVPNLLATAFIPTDDSSKNVSESFDVLRHLGNLSPWFSVEKREFGVNPPHPLRPRKRTRLRHCTSCIDTMLDIQLAMVRTSSHILLGEEGKMPWVGKDLRG